MLNLCNMLFIVEKFMLLLIKRGGNTSLYSMKTSSMQYRICENKKRYLVNFLHIKNSFLF
jgi:hypothetical protein